MAATVGPAPSRATGTAADLVQRQRHVADDPVADLQRPRQPCCAPRVEQPLRQRLGDHLGQLDGRHRDVEFVLGLHPDRPQRRVGAPVVERDERPCRPDVDQIAPESAASRVDSGPAMAMFFGTISPSSTCSVTTMESATTNDTVCSSASGMPSDVERLLQQVRDGGLADPAEQDRAHRDAQLRAGQHQRQVLTGPDHRDRALFALFGQRLEPVAARRDQRELRRDEERVGAQQQHREQDRRRGHSSARPVLAAVVPAR